MKLLCGMQVQGLGAAIQTLLDQRQHTAVSKIPWPTSITATINFSCCAASDSGTASPGRLRRANNVAVLPDGSILAISDREAEYLLRADRSLRHNGDQNSMRVAITNLAFIEWLHPAAVSNAPKTSQPTSTSKSKCKKTLSRALLPRYAFGGSLDSITPRQVDTLGRNVLAAQLFNGETDLEEVVSHCSSHNDAEAQVKRNQRRIRLLGSLLFDETSSPEQVSEVSTGAEQLVQARQRGVYWEGSSLQTVCRQEAEKLRFGSSQNTNE
jgi:hypothetical protein